MVFKRTRKFRKTTRFSKKPARKYMRGKSRPRMYKSRSVLTNIVDTVVRRTSELKSHEYTDVYTFPVALTWNADLVSLVPQGQTSITRVGDRFRLRSLTYNISVYEPNPTASANTSGFVRIIMVQWKPSISAPVSAGDILGGLVEYDSPYNLETRQMYKILYDRIVPLVANTDISRQNFNGTLYFEGADANVQCQSGTTAGTNHIQFMCIASHAGAANTALVRLETFLRFTDN